jgi:tripartite-type tricarboxylate transporter receptor subunit TctC
MPVAAVPGALLGLALLAAPVQAAKPGDAAWPARPIRMLHGFVPGGNVDIAARLVAAQLSERLGQQVLVDGRPGAGGTIGAGIVSRAAADGYTLFLMASGHATSPALYRSLPYDPVKDFTMISMVASSPMLIIASPSFAPRTLQELIAAAKAEPGRIAYGSGGVGSGMHLAAVLFEARAGIKLNHVPFKGGNAAPMAAIAGEIPLVFTTPGGVAPLVDAGRLRVMAVTTRKRSTLWPNVPTIAETVLPEFDVTAWYALAAPRNLPAAMVTRLNEITRAGLERTDTRERLAAISAEPFLTTPREAQQFLAAEVARWTKVIREQGIPPQD